MSVRQRFVKNSVVGLAALLTTINLSTAGADDKNVFVDQNLDSWQQTIVKVQAMEPKWGKQGIDAFKASVDAGVPIQFLDVRTQAEWEKGVLKDALLISFDELPNKEALKQLPEDRQAIIGVYCKGGHRSAMALVLLHQLGYDNAIVMAGGMDAWVEANYPVEAYVPK